MMITTAIVNDDNCNLMFDDGDVSWYLVMVMLGDGDDGDGNV